MTTNVGGYGSRLSARYARLARTTWLLRRVVHLQHAAPDLVFLDRLEQRLEIAFAKTVIALALDEFEKDRPDGVGGKDLQQHLGKAALDHAFAVDQDAVALQARDVFAMLRQPLVDLLEIGYRR